MVVFSVEVPVAVVVVVDVLKGAVIEAINFEKPLVAVAVAVVVLAGVKADVDVVPATAIALPVIAGKTKRPTIRPITTEITTYIHKLLLFISFLGIISIMKYCL